MRKTNPTATTVALMGTGRDKSVFMHLLTGNDRPYVGDDLKYKPDVEVASYVADDGQCVTLVDTPGFDDSHEGVSDVDILERIADFLLSDGGQKLNGLIYMHRISEPRMDYTAKKSLEIFSELCGERNFANVRILTTDWDGVDEYEGETREKALSKRYFKHLIDGGAEMFRHDGALESAQSVVSGLIQQPPVTLKIQEELDAGRMLGNTSAGAVIMKKERIDLKVEMGWEIKGTRDPLEAERRMANVLDDWERLQETSMVQPHIGKKSPDDLMEPGEHILDAPHGRNGLYLVTAIVAVVIAAVGVLVKNKVRAIT